MIKNATFTSVWDKCYKVTSNCKVNMTTKEVFDIEHTVIIRETNSFKTLMKMWETNLKHYEGYTYCVRDRGRMVTLHDPIDNLIVGGIYDPNDEEYLLDHYKFGRNYDEKEQD